MWYAVVLLPPKLPHRECRSVLLAVFCIGSAFQCGAESLLHLIVGRAIGGLGVGALRYISSSSYFLITAVDVFVSMLAPLYMAEISPPEVRGSLMALEQFSIVLGAVLGFWTGFFTHNGTRSDAGSPTYCSLRSDRQSLVRCHGVCL